MSGRMYSEIISYEIEGGLIEESAGVGRSEFEIDYKTHSLIIIFDRSGKQSDRQAYEHLVDLS